MSVLAPTLTKKEFKNWVKGALALLFTKNGLTDFVSAEVDRQHQRLLQLVPAANTLNSCNCKINSLPQCTRNRNHSHIVPGPRQVCSRGVCNILMDAICKYHSFRGPSWKNTDPQKWSTDAFEIVKCFFPQDGYSHSTSLSETDFNGIVSVIINNLSFSTQIQDNLATEPNICTKARKVGREIRHTADHLLSDSDLRDYIDDLINLLCDPACLLHDPSAQDAVRKLRMLKTNDLTIHEKDITEALKDNIKDTFSEEHRDLLQKINDHYSKLQIDSVAEIDRIVGVRKSELEELANKLTEDITRHAELKKHEIEQSEIMKEKKEFEEKLKDLKEDLVTYYRENESMIPAAPLVDEHKVPIEELYFLPPMWAYDKPLNYGLGKNTQQEEQTPGKAQEKQKTSFGQLFLREKNVRYRKIYITADAGFGKTSLSQKLTMTWCQALSPLTSLTENYEGEELTAMKYFNYLFLLHLRDYQSEPLCNLDDLIMYMLSNNLSRNTLYTKDFLQRLLHEKTCLIILDGLDEWAHPDKCRRTPAVPHNNHPESCTVLTTSRPWKLGTIGLSEHNIDRHIEISKLDRLTANQLKENAIRILNVRNLNRAGKNIKDFDEAVESVEIGNIIYNPYILLQLMCVFFGGLPIGKSKCEIYSNITEFTLEHGLKKNDLPDIQGQTNDNAQVPNFMNRNETCKRYYTLLMKLGKLAFYTLFSEKREISLLFDRRIVTQYMTEQEIEFCLKFGLLCQTKDSSIIAVKRYHVFFQHKSVQEFFSAIYITSEWQNESVKSTILNVCSSLSGILEMSNLFVFVCGINPEVYTCISCELQAIVDLDGVTRRTDMIDDDAKTIRSYQSMQMQCLQESMRNRNASCPIHLYVMLDWYMNPTLKTVIHFNKGHVKLLLVPNPDNDTAAVMQSMDPGVFTSLETLRVKDCRKEPVWLADILTESAHTLKFLSLSADLYVFSLYISITAITGLTCLQSLYLGYVLMTHSNLKCLYDYISQTTTLTELKLEGILCSDHHMCQYRDCDVTLDIHRLNELKLLHLSNVYMTHSNLKCLYDYISQTTTLTELKLEWIYCSDHEGQYHDCDVTLDLHCLNELMMLHLSNVQCRQLHMNPACLEKIEFRPRGKMTARASTTLWQDLRAAPVLSSLTLSDITSCQEMMQTIPTLTHLHYLKVVEIDMDDVIPRLSPTMTQIKHVVLQEVTMSSASWQELLLSVDQLQHPVTVELDDCRGPYRNEWRTIESVIKTTPTLSLLQDLIINYWGEASLTLKNKTVQ